MPAALDLNHVMIYSKDVARSAAFYKEKLGFELLEEYPAGAPVIYYARLRVPGSTSTIALHAVERGAELRTGGIRLYFEVKYLQRYCDTLIKSGVVFSKPPALMPWGWRHAYLDDPDGHEISFYTAGAKRLKKGKSF
ncbi:MAG: VOC family protein [Acidobacteria bacterium]|nr:VOC family protein [Acidobacteriota bacterium]